MKNKIELLDPDLFQKESLLNEIHYWLRVLNRPQGWHYDMDILWLFQNLEQAGIKRGSTILDAGAGMGITQFLLAAKGYNVFSLDFTPRVSPPLASGIFNIKTEYQENLEYKHNYMGFIKYGDGQYGSEKEIPIKMYERVLKTLNKGPSHVMRRFKARVRKMRNLHMNTIEKTKDHTGFGNIKLIRAAFHDMPLDDQEVDALVSVSAIEHADPKLMEQNINEMKRVVKKGKPLLITTSATGKNKDWFHEKTQGWCFFKRNINRNNWC